MAMEKNFDAASAEARLIIEWERQGAFRAGANAKPGAEPFCIMIPPPNVTGSLHMGHAFNNTLQDILIRWKRLQGYDVLWQPGTDHAGIATQMVTEREMAANGEPTRAEMGREEFLKRVWQQKVKSRGTIIGQLKRLGASCDWSREAFTMSGAPQAPKGEDGNFHDAVIKVFVDMYQKGLIYRGKRLVNWDPHFESAISDLEVENIEVDGHMWHFKYPLAGGVTYEYVERDEDGNVSLREERDYISIATTRPETMLGDGAVAVHPSDARYAPIVGKLCEIPVGPKEHRRLIPIITDDYPDPDFGSGAVKITGAHDFNDYTVARRGGIPCYRLMDTRAQMRDDGAPYAQAAEIAGAVARGEKVLSEAEADALNLVPDHLRGLDRFEARNRIVEEITAEGLAVMTRADDPRLGKGARKPGEGGVNPALQGVADGAGMSGADTDDAGRAGFTPPPEMMPLVEARKIMQPFGDRSKVVIEPMLTDQWFVDAEKVVGPALEAVRDGRVTIVPESGEKTYFHWLENIEPWCISRQLWWGHQIPVWYGPESHLVDGKEFCAASEAEAAKLAKAHYERILGSTVHIEFPVDGFFTAINIDPMQEGSERNVSAPLVLNDDGSYTARLRRDPDVLDTWFSSGLWPIGTLGWPEQTEELQKYFPTSVLVTGQDILFFWVARMMMMQLAVVGDIPFHHVYLHGLVRDAKGKKMSKSLGNVIDPLEIIDEYGADALRFTNAAMASLGGVLKLDKQRIAGYRNFATKLWNATRFAEMNGVFAADVPAPGKLPPQASATANRWIIGETARTLATVNAALDAYRFNDAASALYQFVWGRVCDWYVEFAKPLLDGDEAGETRATMRWVLDQCFIMLHPFMPFVTEELWGLTGARAKMLVHADWPDYGVDLADPAADREMGWVIGLIEAVRSARAQMRVPVGLRLPMLLLDADEAARAAYAANEALIERLARIDGLHPADSLPRGALSIAVEGASFALPLEGVIDVGAEVARLEKAREKLGKEIGALKGRLGNPGFLEKAGEAVVDEARATLAEKRDEAARLDQALERLAALV